MEPTREQLEGLAEQLASTAPEELDCEAVLARIAAYFESTRDRSPLSPELEKIAQHLSVCPQCLEEFDALVAAFGA